MLVGLASKYNANGAFTDDAFNVKKTLPGFEPKLSHPRLVKWLTITHALFEIILRHLIKRHEALHNPEKVAEQNMKRAAELAAIVVGITDSLLEAYVGLPRNNLNCAVSDACVAGDPNLLMALEAAIMEQAVNFDVLELPIVGDLVRTWHAFGRQRKARRKDDEHRCSGVREP